MLFQSKELLMKVLEKMIEDAFEDMRLDQYLVTPRSHGKCARPN